MKIQLLSLLFLMMYAAGFSQVDGYLSETGTNGSTLIKQNKITREVICSYSFSKNISAITIFTDPKKIILKDSVVAFFDENGNITQRIRTIKKTKSILIDTFYYNNDNQLTQISTSAMTNNQEVDIGYTIYTYGDNKKVDHSSSSYTLPNGIIKNSVVKNVYNKKNQLIEVWKESNLSSLVLAEKYFYDRRGRIKRIDNFNYDYCTKYNYSCRRTQLYSTNENEYYHKTLWVYNRHHQCIRRQWGTTIDEFLYNEDGTLAESKSHYEDDMFSVIQHRYYKD